jgi:hypothetical protein
MRAEVERAREPTSKPIGANLLLFGNEALIEPVLELEPAVFSTAWARDDKDLAAIFARAHERGATVMHMVTTLPDAVAAAEARSARPCSCARRRRRSRRSPYCRGAWGSRLLADVVRTVGGARRRHPAGRTSSGRSLPRPSGS